MFFKISIDLEALLEKVKTVAENIVESTGLTLLPDGSLLDEDGTLHTYEEEFGSMTTAGDMKLRKAIFNARRRAVK